MKHGKYNIPHINYLGESNNIHVTDSTILERLNNCENVKYVISHNYVEIRCRIKTGKSDGFI